MKASTEELKSIVEELANLNPGVLTLSGSLAMSLQGIKQRRDPNDIDILIKRGTSLNKPSGMFETGEYDNGYELEDEETGQEELFHIVGYNYKNVKIDVFYPSQEIVYREDQLVSVYFCKNIKMLNPFEIMKFKLSHAFGSAFSRFKHKDDIIYILVNNID